MKHPVLITPDAVGTTHRAEIRDWLAANNINLNGRAPSSVRPFVFTGNTVVEPPGSLDARGWTVSRPFPRHLLTRLADLSALSCTAVLRPGTDRCHLLVDVHGVHGGMHQTADEGRLTTDAGADVPGWWSIEPAAAEQPLWRQRNLLRQPRNRAALLIGEEQLVDLMRLPHGQRIIGFDPQFLTLSLAVHLEGEGLPSCPDGAEPWRIGTGLHRPFTTSATEPDRIHTEVLAALATPAHLEGFRSYQARLRALDRHQPRTNTPGASPFCGHCCDPEDHDQHQPWPCPDYQDAAAPVTVYAWIPTDTDSEDDQP